RELCVLCPCGILAPPKEIRWVAECCGACHDLRQQGGGQRTWQPEGSRVFSPDGRTLASGRSAGEPYYRGHLWDVAARRERLQLPEPISPDVIVFSPDGRFLAARGQATGLALWNTRTGKKKVVLEHAPEVLPLVFAPNGRTLAAAPWRGDITIWHAASGKKQTT